MTFSIARTQYLANITHAHNLVAVHRKAGLDAQGKSPRGKRGAQTSVNRAIVLMAVATWQATVQDLTLAAFEYTQSPVGVANVTKLANEVEAFSTPATHQVRRLFAENIQMAGAPNAFDPSTHWTWSKSGGRGVGRRTIDSVEISHTLDAWVLMRHAVAHGHDELFNGMAGATLCDVTQPWVSHKRHSPGAVVDHYATALVGGAQLTSRQARAGKNPSLTLKDAEMCLSFFDNLTRVTALGLMAHVGHKRHGNTKARW